MDPCYVNTPMTIDAVGLGEKVYPVHPPQTLTPGWWVARIAPDGTAAFEPRDAPRLHINPPAQLRQK